MTTVFYLALFSPDVLVRFKTKEDIPNIGFEIDFDQFTHGLRQLWSDVSLNIEADSIEWELEDEDGIISGTADNTCLVTLMPGSTRRIVEFINWYRDFVPEQHTLYLFHLGQPNGIKIEGGNHIKETELEIF